MPHLSPWESCPLLQPAASDPVAMLPVQDIMREPVMAADGHTYERLAIADWLAQHDTSPLTNEVMPSKQLQINHLVRQAISALFGDRPS